jgi:signal transduction histidine kinase
MAFLEVLSIFLANAGEALPAGGDITIRTWQSEGAVHCVVEDSGVGMSEDVRRRAMEPFFTTKGPERKGLGLSVAYGIIRRHQGEIEITSAEGAGTLVTVRLPLATPARRNGDRAHLVPASRERI